MILSSPLSSGYLASAIDSSGSSSMPYQRLKRPALTKNSQVQVLKWHLKGQAKSHLHKSSHQVAELVLISNGN